ncbi:MAG: hypothetical protein B6245_00830 [Desulfobacteraceae bacterium 4572_88]|nr:MAG: hypothetical protein B6245_00830 [Desulfobacteraceae bacterium 4572_88]
MNKQVQPEVSVEQIIRNLHRKRREVLSLPAEKALDEVLEHPQPAALVHSITEEDFYFFIHDIGVNDAVELLSLASDQQWEYIVDTEVWKADRISMKALGRWLHLLLRADPDRLFRWFLKEKTEFVELYLSKNTEVRIREHDQDPSDLGEGFFTLDDVFYVRFPDALYEDKESGREQRDEFLWEFLNRLATRDHVTYQRVLLESSGIISAESEEEAYRLRNVRLAEKGFMPFEEAVGVYQPLKPEGMGKWTKKLFAGSDHGGYGVPVPFYPVEMLKKDDIFTLSLSVIEISEVLWQLQSEFAGLCNQVISADQKQIQGREQLRHVVEKVCGYISIGLERLTEKENTGHSVHHTAALIQKFPLSRIFRVGYGLALDLKWRAEKWHKKSWFREAGLSLTFWGEEWLGVVGGLLIKRPLFFDNYKTGMIYREFASIQDIRETEDTLNEIVAFDKLLSHMALSPGPVTDAFLTYKNFILTFWIRHHLGLSETLSPIDIEDFKRFFRELGIGRGRAGEVPASVKESFLKWLSDKSGMDTYDITLGLGKTLENIFQELEDEYGDVAEEYLDPRYIHLFLVM